MKLIEIRDKCINGQLLEIYVESSMLCGDVLIFKGKNWDYKGILDDYEIKRINVNANKGGTLILTLYDKI